MRTPRSPTSDRARMHRRRSAHVDRQAHDEARAEDGRRLRPAPSPGRVRFSALIVPRCASTICLRDRQAEAGILAERGFLLGAVGVEALEDALELVGANARAVVLDDDLDRCPRSAAQQRRAPSVRSAERAGIVDEVVEHLAEPAVVAEDEVGARASAGRNVELDLRPLAGRRRGRRTIATTVVSSWRRSTGALSWRASSASRREASEMSLISRSSRRMSCWMMPVSRALASSVLASGSVSTALRSEVSGFFSSCATSAAKLSIASMRL